VRRKLFGVKPGGIDRAVMHHPSGEIAARSCEQRLGRGERAGGSGKKSFWLH
jgi:hypothetical protein